MIESLLCNELRKTSVWKQRKNWEPTQVSTSDTQAMQAVRCPQYNLAKFIRQRVTPSTVFYHGLQGAAAIEATERNRLLVPDNRLQQVQSGLAFVMMM